MQNNKIDYKARKAARKANRGFSVAFFTPGTVVEFDGAGSFINNGNKLTVTVDELIQNGPDSFLVKTNLPGHVTGHMLDINIAHATRIVSHVPGKPVFERSGESAEVAEDQISLLAFHLNPLRAQKHPSNYLTISQISLANAVAHRLIPPGHVYDQDVLAHHLARLSLFTEVGADAEVEYPQYWKVNKKRFRKVIKRLLPKCYITLQAAQAEYDKPWGEDGHFDFLDREDTGYTMVTNEHGFPQCMQQHSPEETPVAVCSECHCLVEVNRGQGVDCPTCQAAQYNEMEHDYGDFL